MVKKVEISWSDLRRATAALVGKIADGGGPEQLRLFYRRMQPRDFAHFTIGLGFGLCTIQDFDDDKSEDVAVFVRRFLREWLKEKR